MQSDIKKNWINYKLVVITQIQHFNVFFGENLVPLSDTIFISDNSSPTHLYIRPKNVEMDVDLLDEHDSFYKTTKSLLNLFQIMGIMPIRRSPPGKLLTNFEFRSIQ